MLFPDLDQREHYKSGDQKIDSRARRSDQERIIAAHIPGVGLKRKRLARDDFDQECGGSEDPSKIVNIRERIIGLEASGDEENGYRSRNVVENVLHGCPASMFYESILIRRPANISSVIRQPAMRR